MTGSAGAPEGGLRDRNRARTCEEIQNAAMSLFRAQGFASTTVAQVARAAGVSPRTFFRHFRSKDDLVLDAPVGYGAVLAATLRACPEDDDPWEVLRATLRARTSYWQRRPEIARLATELLADSEGAQGRLRAKTVEWHDELARALRPRLDGPEDTRRLRADALVGTALSCLDAAFMAWRRDPGLDLDRLFDEALHAVRPRPPADGGPGEQGRSRGPG